MRELATAVYSFANNIFYYYSLLQKMSDGSRRSDFSRS